MRPAIPTQPSRRRRTPLPAAATVAIAASHKAVGASLRVLLTSDVGLDLIATAADARGAARLMLQHHPDVLVMALSGGLSDGGALLHELCSMAPDTSVVVTATASSDAYSSVALAAGAAALVALDGPSDDILRAVHAAAATRRAGRIPYRPST